MRDLRRKKVLAITPGHEEISGQQGEVGTGRVEGLGPLGVAPSEFYHLILLGVILVAGDDGTPLE